MREDILEYPKIVSSLNLKSLPAYLGDMLKSEDAISELDRTE